MSEKKLHSHLDGEYTVDDLLAQSREQMQSAPGQAVFSDHDLKLNFSEETPVSEAPQAKEPVDFMPDFGDAFDDYGEYHVPAEAPVEEFPEDYQEDDFDGEEEDRGPEKPRNRQRRRIVPLFVKVLLYLVIVGVAAVGLGFAAWECAQDLLAFGRSDEQLSVTIHTGDSVDAIAQMLKDEGVIKYPWLFKFYCNFTDSNEKMDPGVYDICYNYDYHALVSSMRTNSNNRVTVRVMIQEGATCAQIFALLEKNNVCTVEQLEECAASTEFDYWFLEGIPYGAENRLEGFLFPDTYDFYEEDNPSRVLEKFLSNFNKKFTDEAKEQLTVLNETLAQRLRNAGYGDDYIAAHEITVYELITVASMIERESGGVQESGDISAVIYNRLCNPANFPYLQIDATIVYALGGITEALTYEDLQYDSPYNTYLYSGLPVGPISNPGLNSIAASLYPSDENYYYYALDKSTGFHYFARTYDEFNRFLQENNQ